MSSPTIAVIGAGLASLACARLLAEAGATVRIFEKSRGLGGRMATRRHDTMQFDHGAQYATARDADFQRLLDSLAESGGATIWPAASRAKGERCWVGVPSMAAIAHGLGSGLEVSRQDRIEQLEKTEAGWRLQGVKEAFDAVVLALPEPQARALWPALAKRTAGVDYAPCLTAMAAFDRTLATEKTFQEVEDHPRLALAACDSAKPGRHTARECWVLHGTPEFSQAMLKVDPDATAHTLLDDFRNLASLGAQEPDFVAGHRWRYALVRTPLGEDFIWEGTAGLGACGDWCIAPRLEAAFLSGRALAGAILADHGPM